MSISLSNCSCSYLAALSFRRAVSYQGGGLVRRYNNNDDRDRDKDRDENDCDLSGSGNNGDEYKKEVWRLRQPQKQKQRRLPPPPRSHLLSVLRPAGHVRYRLPLLLSQPDRSCRIRAPPNVGPLGPRWKEGGGNASGGGIYGLKVGDCDGSGLQNRNRIRIGRSDVHLNIEVVCWGEEEKVRGGGYREGDKSKVSIQ